MKRRFLKRIGIGILLALVAWGSVDYLRLPSAATLKEQLGKQRPKTTALMEQRKEQAAAQGKKYTARTAWVSLPNISEHLIHAVITTEDGNFFNHHGVDWEELKISVRHDIEEGEPLRGASTITQQLAKNLFLDQSRSPLRKLRELVIAHRLEEALPKTRILELYLNLIEWGPGIYGCELAAQNNFGKGAADLSREEAAALAAVIASPLKHLPGNDADRFVARRSAMILNRMAARGW